MASRTIELEVQQAIECIEQGKNFILTGGAGSGKTYSLISLIEEVGEKYPSKSIVCITYTNNAVAEIRNRITNDKLYVSTIHEFVWSIIAKYQKEIKNTLVELINDESQMKFKAPRDFEENQMITIDYFSENKIVYDEYYSLRSDADSKVSHDHILILAEKIFEKFPKICGILKDVANFIFVDEYQDTDPLIKNILLTHINQSTKKNIVGFFGDSMQAIYDNGLGEIIDDKLTYINKFQNRRNPESVICLANKIRNDDIEQTPSNDPKAPNIENNNVIKGSIKFLYTENINITDNYRDLEYFNDWDFTNSEKTKELWLVHKSNAKMAGFTKLFELYNSDLIIELINRIRKKISTGALEINNKTFENIAEEANIEVRGRGYLLENIKKDSDYLEAFSLIKNENWEEVNNFKINKDSLLSYKFNGLIGSHEAKSQRDRILRHLDSIYELIELYENGKYNDFLRRIKRSVLSFHDKVTIKEEMNELLDSTLTINQVVEKAKKTFNLKNESFDDFIENQGSYLWMRIKMLPFSEYVYSIKYQKEYLPFATQHSIKGSEFDNVLVILDNGKWNKYNFEKMFKNFNSDDSVVKRTKKLFYVCCTRPKKNLVVLMPSVDVNVVEKAKDLFGDSNVHHIL
ncbi:UvrD-helicase domain-containing protein [Enterococcus faecalis]|uniref:UvrD-helicase domain-containing protein n=1 Tax=Enterococcus faecalis TaxID=1351 RepID=UPI0001B2E594|nr:UvrD-helicase domain-containing protein [Enterococcus faecalis]EEU78767.1 UvrD/REP helicase [Enterococcus faecalis Fly1]EGO2631825.1 ATP-dependent helicase [Enterococcus faecalis]EGO7617570.1 ATP-dependent helicase [Enterococcus faecalis]EGO7912403.1 ATP-dependent helicase [Enterococcus faecalis]EHG5970362.1 ATP-dependent helicase [Enterococcus faecalis]